MRTRWCLLLMVFVLAVIRAAADTVKLKDGTVLEGDITGETDTTLSIYLEFSNGTITQTRQINKADIARIIRWTPEQRAQHDFARLQRYQLSSNDSFKVEYYDQIMDGVFAKFLAQYPSSSLASNVTGRLGEWKAERDLVSAGNVKFHGRWSPFEEVASAIERERGQRMLQEARLLVSHGRLESAIQQLQQVVRMNGQPELVSQAKPLLASASQMAGTLLEQQRQQLENDVSSAQQRVTQVNQTLSQALAAQQQAASSGQSLSTFRTSQGVASYRAMGAGSQAFVQTQTAVNRARDDCELAQSHLEQLKSQLNVVAQKLATLKSTAPTEHVVASADQPANSPPPAASASAPTSPVIADLPGPLTDIIVWMRKNYVALAIIGLGLVYAMSRFAKG